MLFSKDKKENIKAIAQMTLRAHLSAYASGIDSASLTFYKILKDAETLEEAREMYEEIKQDIRPDQEGE